MSSKGIETKRDLLDHINRDWKVLNSFLSERSETELIELKNEDSWTIKDHVAHLAIWESSVIALLKGKHRHEGLGISEELYLEAGIDAINQAIFEQHRHKNLIEIEADFRRTHNELLSLIDGLSDEELNLPYSHFLPDEDKLPGPRTINIIYGNTAFHYREHQKWMEEMLDTNSD